MTSGNGSTHKELKRDPIVAPRVTLLGNRNNSWRVYLAQGTTIEEVCEPKFWANVGFQFNQFDDVRAYEETGAYVVDLVVTACDRNWAQMKALAKYDLDAVKPEVIAQANAAITIEWAGPHHRFRGVRKADGAVIKSGMQTRAEAEIWLSEYRETVG